ncbi:11223_t:CDS:2, partial [Acaulospora morrowiae]
GTQNYSANYKRPLQLKSTKYKPSEKAAFLLALTSGSCPSNLAKIDVSSKALTYRGLTFEIFKPKEE